VFDFFFFERDCRRGGPAKKGLARKTVLSSGDEENPTS
jgi:hypothetical protein